jgi:4-alpha-glucanotransferase
MTNTAIELLSLAASLAALLGTVIVVDWPLIREWAADRRFQRQVANYERNHAEQLRNQAEFEALAAHPEAPHPWDTIPYDLRRVIHPDPAQVDDPSQWN